MKALLLSAFCWIQIDRLFRFINRKKILVLAYHGITDKRYAVAPWTLIHRDIFEEQVGYVSRRYHVVSLRQVAESMAGKGALPSRAAVITFDDGYRNNLTVAFPVLHKYRVSSTIFLTAGYINSSEMLPLDEACVIVISSKKKGKVSSPKMGLENLGMDTSQERCKSCSAVVQWMKRHPVKAQKSDLELLKEVFECDAQSYDRNLVEDCRMLSWDEARGLIQSGFIDIGAHTISHEILSNVPMAEATAEILNGKRIMEENLQTEVDLFAYPNGQGQDFGEEHIELLRQSGFLCSVTTMPRLNPPDSHPFQIGRFSVGPDSSIELSHFALRTSGALTFMSTLRG